MTETGYHQPVLYHEIINVLSPISNGYYVDCTVGAGGHAWGILEASEPDGHLLGLDLDPQALHIARDRLRFYQSRTILIRASYATIQEQLDSLNWPCVDGILLDLGLSSMQLENNKRGFSFNREGPLDMRFDPQSPLMAVDLVNRLPADELADLLFKYGEERNSRKIARAIAAARPIQTTRQLAEILASVTTGGKSGIHPATRTFQALRIAVNNELEALEIFLPQAIDLLSPKGRIAVIAYHSLEDRIVKLFFRKESSDCICPPRQPICTCGHKATLKIVTRRPIRPTDGEIKRNPRARSARLRVAERINI